MKSIKQLIAGIAIAVTAFSANANTQALTFSGENAYFGNTLAIGTTSFDDFFTFVVPAANTGSAGASVVAGFSFWGPTTVLNSFELFSGTPGSGSLIASAAWFVPGIVGNLGATGLAAGSYFLEAKGNVTLPSSGGSYSGNANLIVTSIPEPGEWALMLSGFGLIALMVRRRTANAS